MYAIVTGRLQLIFMQDSHCGHVSVVADRLNWNAIMNKPVPLELTIQVDSNLPSHVSLVRPIVPFVMTIILAGFAKTALISVLALVLIV